MCTDCSLRLLAFHLLASWFSSIRLNNFGKTGERSYGSKLHKFQLPGIIDFGKFRTSAVRTTDLMVGTQLCKLSGTSDTLVGRAYSTFHL